MFIYILLFRILLLLSFLVSVYKLGDWKNWQRYYPTVLYVMVLNLTASFLTYHHVLWHYNPDIVVTTSTTVEMFNSYIMLPATTVIFLSRLPASTKNQYAYILLWVCIYGSLEFVDHYIVEGLSYKHGWGWFISVIFDIAMFSLIRLHYTKPVWAWGWSLVTVIAIIVMFDFMQGEFK